MKKYFWIIGGLVLISCASLPGEPELWGEESKTPALSIIPRRFISLRQIHNGMTKREVASVLNKMIIVGYEMSETDSQQYKPITITNPYRLENVRKGAQTYEVVYYIQGVVHADGQTTEDELVPLVFEQDRLIGMGWDFLRKNIKNL